MQLKVFKIYYRKIDYIAMLWNFKINVPSAKVVFGRKSKIIKAKNSNNNSQEKAKK
jgi:hypothetical protein